MCKKMQLRIYEHNTVMRMRRLQNVRTSYNYLGKCFGSVEKLLTLIFHKNCYERIC